MAKERPVWTILGQPGNICSVGRVPPGGSAVSSRALLRAKEEETYQEHSIGTHGQRAMGRSVDVASAAWKERG